MEKEIKRGLFITFEGIDGSGKSTQAKILAERIKAELTQEPYDAVYNEEIRKILREDKDPYSKSEKLTDLFIKDRWNHLEKFIIPNINAGKHVVSDRYDLSTIAYQAAQGQDLRELINLHKNMLVPKATYIINTPAEIARTRTNKKEKKFESAYQFQKDVSDNYFRAARLLIPKGRNIVIIQGNKSIEKVADNLWEAFKPLYENWQKD